MQETLEATRTPVDQYQQHQVIEPEIVDLGWFQTIGDPIKDPETGLTSYILTSNSTNIPNGLVAYQKTHLKWTPPPGAPILRDQVFQGDSSLWVWVYKCYYPQRPEIEPSYNVQWRLGQPEDNFNIKNRQS